MMSLKKKDLTTPSGLRVAANDPHLVSLGGGRLSTAVTIHYLPLGDMTIGSSPNCNISLNGSGVRSVHCTVYRNEQGEVTIIPENDARVLIDGTKITNETNLTQGAMLTIGNSNYLRFNNPAEAQLIKSTMGSNERISMPQIDFTQDDVTTTGGSNNISETPEDVLKTFNAILESQQEIYQKPNNEAVLLEKMTKIEYYNINNFHSPKVFTADSITVNAPAKDVLGPKYANFAKNLVENHKNDKNLCTKNTNEMNSKTTNYVNIPSSFIQNSNNCTTSGTTTTTTTASTIIAQNNEILTKVNNTNSNSNNNNNIGIRNNTQQIAASSYDRYPKPGSYGGLQLFPMNGINSEINTSSFERQNSYNLDNNNDDINERFIGNHINQDQQQETKITAQEQERLEEILKICTEYDRQQNQINNSNSNSNNNSVQSSPIVQNRIKTNGSLPRDKKSPFYDISSNTQSQSSSSTSSSASIHHHHHHHSKKTVFFPEKSSSSSSIQQNHHNSGYENVRLIGDRHIEIGDNNSIIINSQKSNGYENVIIGKYIPQSPRTKIRTTCPSPKKEQQQQQQHQHQHQHQQTIVHSSSSNEYAHLIQSFEEKLRMEMEAIKENSKLKDKSLGIIINSNSNNSSNSCSSKSRTQDHNDSKRQNRNINNLTLNLEMDNNDNIDKEKLLNLQKDREICLARIRQLKTKIAEVQRQEDEVLRELDMEKALVSAELSTVSVELTEMERNYINLQNKIHRLEAQRNANRVMQETQQAKLKQTIEMKQEQVTRLKNLLQENHYNDDTLKEELEKQFEWLENDRKTFEDLEFQYLEEETDWLAYREELHKDLKLLSKHIDEKRSQLLRLEQQDVENQSTACSDTKSLETDLLTLLKMLEKSREELQEIDKCIFNISGQQQPQQTQSDSEDDDGDGDDGDVDLNQIDNQYRNNLMSQSLFGSAEILSSATKPKDHKNDLMSRSVNENMFFNNIETPTTQNDSSLLKTSTPKKELKIFDISDDTALIKVRHQYTNNNDQQKNMSDITTDFVRRENHDEKDPILKLKYNVENSTSPNGDVDNNKDGGADDDDDDDAAMKHTKVNLNLSLGSDDFEVNPLERRIPSQDDIDRISKITLDAPISTKGASSKIIESIKEIERNRQLLLAQQGSHVIEHERQKMVELKKKSHDEARAQYLSSQNEEQSSNFNKKTVTIEGSEGNDLKKRVDNSFSEEIKPLTAGNHGKDRIKYRNEVEEESSQQRHSHPPEHESQHNQRPLSEANSEFSYDNLSEKQEESGGGGGGVGGGLHSLSNRLSENSEDFKRSSYNSTDTLDDDRPTNGKRGLPKHQRPLTRYLPIMSADLDLRQHIESAGHQIALCPHVFVDSYSCRGYLHKLGATFHGWSRRWFVLDRQKCALIYYSDKSERKPRGGAYFTTIDEVYLDHLNTSKSGRPHCTFIVKTKKRSYHLQAASDAAARIWIDAIITGAQGNIDY